MIETVFVGALVLFGLVLLPILLIVLLAKLLFGLILLPFRLLGVVAGAAFGILGFFLKLFGLVLLAIGGFALVGFLPLILLVLVVWGLFRLLRPRPSVTQTA